MEVCLWHNSAGYSQLVEEDLAADGLEMDSVSNNDGDGVRSGAT